MKNPSESTYYAYALVRQATAKSKPVTQKFDHKDFCVARERYLIAHEEDTQNRREGHFTTGYFPSSQLFFLQVDAEMSEIDRIKVFSNRHDVYAFGKMEPLAKLMIDRRIEGFEWFAEDEAGERLYFQTEIEAQAFVGEHYADHPRQLYNLDKYLDYMEGQSIQHFLVQRSALSTNQLEVLANLAKSTLSKIKNGQRILSRKQYARIVRVLQHYGYQPWVDLRVLG